MQVSSLSPLGCHWVGSDSDEIGADVDRSRIPPSLNLWFASPGHPASMLVTHFALSVTSEVALLRGL
jgi:hypothetical protein